jgi:hypothetical protein
LKKLAFIILFSSYIFADISLIVQFKKGLYSKICMNRWSYINKYLNKREDLLSLVAFSCLKKKYLTPALDLAKVLKTTKIGRENATYITTLFLMKKLIIQFIMDKIDLKNIKLPQIKDDKLGIIFYKFQQNKFKQKNNRFIIDNNATKWIIYLNKNYNIVIETHKNDKVKKEIYW